MAARHPSRRTPSSRSPSKSPSPDPELVRYLNEQKRPHSPDSDAYREKRIAAQGVLNVKSRHQKDKEVAEKRRQEEEKDAAKVYEEFVQDMQGDRRGGGSKGNFVRAGGQASYEPRQSLGFAPVAPRAMTNNKFDHEDAESSWAQIDEDEHDATSHKREVPGKRKRAMDDFLGELQRNQAFREERLKSQVSEGTSISTILAQEAGGSSKPWDSPDPDSTNVCVLNLPANVNEATLGEYFSRYGDVASVKIMWSRVADTMAPALRVTKFPGSTGFINYMTRADANRAYRETEDSFWMGSQLKVGWGKALRKPLQPLFYKASSHGDRREIQEHSRAEGNNSARLARSGLRNHRRVRERSKSPISLLKDAIKQEGEGGEEREKRIFGLAMPVREYGRGYEEMVQQREEANPLYDFLRSKGSVAHQYYRALLGDRVEPEIPSPLFQDIGEASLYSSDSEEDSEREQLQREEKIKVLGKAARRRLEAMLRGITLRRERIARIMLFAIEHASAAETVTKVIIQSLLQPATPLPRKLARLYVVSDILHNSSVSASNAWRYRSLFEGSLDLVFLHWGDMAASFNGRIKRESCKELVRNLLNVWENWLVYESSKLGTWSDSLETGSQTTREETDDGMKSEIHGQELS
ncbi:hypothetical protein CBS101457_002305 [Exobasidium rhododendri]|nr:hypothetical protein CBS101457_002305 [Exobasidium rhododendri]